MRGRAPSSSALGARAGPGGPGPAGHPNGVPPTVDVPDGPAERNVAPEVQEEV